LPDLPLPRDFSSAYARTSAGPEYSEWQKSNIPVSELAKAPSIVPDQIQTVSPLQKNAPQMLSGFDVSLRLS
jgi:hypothetical protein